MSDISKEINRDDIFTIWLVITGVIRVKTPIAEFYAGKMRLPTLK